MHRVLVIDDHVDVAPMVAAVIVALGHEARYATSCAEALPIAEEFQPDTVFVDLAMPHINGFECARRLRELLGDKIRLFAMSGYAAQKWPEVPRVFDKYLLKPVMRETIREVIGE